MPSDRLRIGIVQMSSTSHVEQNLKIMDGIVEQILSQKQQVSLLCFPENCLCMRSNDKQELPRFSADDGLWLVIARWANDLNCTIHLGSVPWYDSTNLYNASLVMVPGETKPQISYKKIHLFDANLADGQTYRESATFTGGHSPSMLDVEGSCWGQSICFDVRFSELYTYYRNQRVDGLLIPAAFTVPTGLAHWQVLLRARAIETQSYVIAAAQCGEHRGLDGAVRRTYGHSLVVDPWGAVLWDGGEKPGYNIIELDLERVRKVRQQIPVCDLRRL